MQAESDTTAPRPKRRKFKYAKAYGYIIDPCIVVPAEIEKGTDVPSQFAATFSRYRRRLTDYCGIGYDDMIPVRNPEPHFPPAFCVPVATNLSKASRIPRTDVMERAKEFLAQRLVSFPHQNCDDFREGPLGHNAMISPTRQLDIRS